LRQEIIALALQARLITPFTAFVAIDHESSIGDPVQRQIIHVAQPLPLNLERSGFIPPQAPAAFQAMAPKGMGINTGSLDLPAFLRNSQSKTTGGIQAMPLPPSPAGRLQDSAAQFDTHQKTDFSNESLEVVLRWLARTQLVNGSWHDDVEQTSAALLAFVRHGHTTRSGNFRQIVKRAFSWLESQSVMGKDSFIKTLALAELAAETQQPAHRQAVTSCQAGLPVPSSLFEKAVIAFIDQKSLPVMVSKTEVNNMDDLRLYAALKLPIKVPPILFEGVETELARTWSAVLK
jgi:hypothetical protein